MVNRNPRTNYAAASEELVEIEHGLIRPWERGAFALKFLKDCFSDRRVAGESAWTTTARLVNGGEKVCVEAPLWH